MATALVFMNISFLLFFFYFTKICYCICHNQIIPSRNSRFQGLLLLSCVSRSSASYRLKDTVFLKDIWLYGFEEDEDEDEEEQTAGDVDLRVTIVLAWALKLFLVTFW